MITTGAPTVEAEIRRRLAAGLLASVPAETRRVHLADAVEAMAPLLPPGDVARTVDRLLARVEGLGPLDPLLADPDVTEVMVNGPGPVWVEREGRILPTPVHLDADEIAGLVERIVSPLGLRADRSSPMADARLADGSRVNVVVPPLAVDGPCITVRRFRAHHVPLDDFCPAPVAELLRWACAARQNLIVSGGTGAGKTTLLNALASELPRHERIVTLEDAAELRLPGDHVVRLEARPGNAEGLGVVSIRDLLRNVLRMRPDRIVIGEVRGPEALDLLQAMNTGHDGSLSTCHANSPRDALRRLEAMVLMDPTDLPLAAVRDHIGAALDLVVHVGRTPRGGRRILAVAEPAPDGRELRPLADHEGVHALPARVPRAHDVPPPDDGWIER